MGDEPLFLNCFLFMANWDWLTHCFVRVKILIRFWWIPLDSGTAGPPLRHKESLQQRYTICLIILKGALSWFPSGQIPSCCLAFEYNYAPKVRDSIIPGNRRENVMSWCGTGKVSFFSLSCKLSLSNPASDMCMRVCAFTSTWRQIALIRREGSCIFIC